MIVDKDWEFDFDFYKYSDGSVCHVIVRLTRSLKMETPSVE